VVILIFWSAITRPTIQKIVVPGTGTGDGRLWENLNYNDCNWGNTDVALQVFYGIEGVYKILMIGYGIFLSLALWKYGSSMWAESKQMLFAIYNMITFALIGLALQLSLVSDFSQSTRTVLFVTRSMCIFLSGIITVSAMLLPRLLDPDGEGHEGKSATGTSTRTAAEASLALNDLEWRFENLEQKYKNLEEDNVSVQEKYKALKQQYKEAVPDATVSEEKED